MAFEEEGGLASFKPYKEMEVGEVVVEGWYKGRRKGKFNIPNFEVIDKDTGAVKLANGCGLLERKFKDSAIVPGDYIRIEYAGMDKMKKGPYAGTLAHNLKLFRDKTLFDAAYGAPGEVVEKREEQKKSPDHKPPTRKPQFEEEVEESPAVKRKRFADSLPVEDEEDDGEFVL